MFTNRISGMLAERGRRMMGWNEILGSDVGRQAEVLPGEASSRGGGGRPYPAVPTGRAYLGALLNRQPET